MILVSAVVGTFAAALWTFIVAFANGMRSAPGKFQYGGTVLAAWAAVAALWLAAWWFS